jgi:hypothetical protein
MRNTTRCPLALALPLLGGLVACGSVTPEPGVLPQDAPRELARAICPKAYECCMATELMSNDNAGTDVATCETKTEAALARQVSAIEASERQGRVVYDGTKVQACIDLLTAATTTCDDLATTSHLTGLPACASFLQPKVAVGGACSQDFECVDGFCDRTGVAAGADGACRALGHAGDSCADAQATRCAPDLVCEAANETCAAPTLAAPPAAKMCFYSSGCSVRGGSPRRAALTSVGILLALVMGAARRRRGH